MFRLFISFIHFQFIIFKRNLNHVNSLLDSLIWPIIVLFEVVISPLSLSLFMMSYFINPEETIIRLEKEKEKYKEDK